MLQVNIVLHINHADPILEIMKVYFIKKFSFIISYRYDFYSENCKNLGDFSNLLKNFIQTIQTASSVKIEAVFCFLKRFCSNADNYKNGVKTVKF